MSKQLFILIVFSIISGSAFANNCDFSFTAFSAAESSYIVEENTVYIPVDVVRNDTRKKCRSTFYLSLHNQNQLVFHSNGNQLNAEVTNHKKRVKNPTMVDGELSWLNSKRKTLRTQYTKLVVAPYTPPGTYTTTVKVKALMEGVEVHSELVPLTLVVPPMITANISNFDSSIVMGDAGSYQVNFGQLQSGQQTNWTLNVVSNTHFDLTLNSENGGLKHLSSSDKVLYTIQADSHLFESQQGSFNTRINHINTATAKAISMSLTINNVSLQKAGQYQDVFSVTVTAN